jgi:hypothetical protein
MDAMESCALHNKEVADKVNYIAGSSVLFSTGFKESMSAYPNPIAYPNRSDVGSKFAIFIAPKVRAVNLFPISFMFFFITVS